MSESELVGVIFQFRNQINFLWNFYVTAGAILIGWLFTGSIRWSRETYLTISLFFIIFAIINASAMHTEYKLLQYTLEDLKASSELTGSFLLQLSRTRGLGAYGALYVHLVVDMFLLWLLRNRYVKAKQSATADEN